MAQVKNNYKKQ